MTALQSADTLQSHNSTSSLDSTSVPCPKTMWKGRGLNQQPWNCSTIVVNTTVKLVTSISISQSLYISLYPKNVSTIFYISINKIILIWVITVNEQCCSIYQKWLFMSEHKKKQTCNFCQKVTQDADHNVCLFLHWLCSVS